LTLFFDFVNDATKVLEADAEWGTVADVVHQDFPLRKAALHHQHQRLISYTATAVRPLSNSGISIFRAL